MSLSTQPYKGTRDFYPDDMRTRKWMFAKWRKVVESFGYEEYDGPILEPIDLFTAKTSEEIVNDQSFNFEDRGGRRVIMRPEMTPTVSRMVAGKRQELGYPLRLYSIPNCFRYERQQRGRLREFWQLNVDLFGIEGVEADVENVLIVDALMKEFGADLSMFRVEIGSRNLLNEVADKYGISDKAQFIRLVDKKEKISKEQFEQELSQIMPDKTFFDTVIYVLNLKSLEGLRTGLNLSSLDKVREVMLKVDGFVSKGSETNIVFNPSVARGFEYYTDIVFEVFDKNPENTRSLFGGGRYDGLVGEFGVEPVPTVGFGMGDVTFQNFLESHGLIEERPSETDVYIVVIGDALTGAQKLAHQLRGSGINVAVDLSGKKDEKQIKNARKKHIPYLIFIGDNEASSETYTLLHDATNTKYENQKSEDIVKIIASTN